MDAIYASLGTSVKKVVIHYFQIKACLQRHETYVYSHHQKAVNKGYVPSKNAVSKGS